MDPYHTPMPMLANPLGPAVHTQSANRTLYVGNLDKDIDRQKLFEHFANANRTDCIENVIIKKDISGESRGFAFITFTNPADALRAKTVFNHSKIKENQITVSFMRQPQDLDPNANLFFRNLHSNVTAKDLEELCAPYGSIVCCRLKFDSAGHPLGYGYVQFEKEQSATECLEAVKGRMLQEKPIGVEKFVPRTRRGAVSQKCNVYVKDFPASWSEKQVVDFIASDFGKYGKITSKAIAKDNKIGRHYAFVAFDKPEEARSAIEGLNGHVFAGEDTKLYVDFAQSKEQRRKILREKHLHTKNETNLFIKSLMLDVTEEKLKKAFEKYGTVTSVCVRTHELSKPAAPGGDKKSLKFGFVNFATTEAAQNALNEGKKDPVIKALIDPSHYQQSEFICLAQPKSVRSQYLKMTLKAKKSTQLLQRQQKAWEAVLQQFARSMNPKGMGGKKQPYDVQNKRGAEYANPAGINPMMLMQGFNPQLMAGQMPFGNPAMPNQMMMMNPSLMGMTSIPGMVPQTNALLAQQQAAAVQEQMRLAAAANVKDVRWLKANLAEFESYPHDEKKNLLGNMMYNKVKELKPPNDLIPKITGMLIDLEVLSIAEIIELLESKDLLQERMNEAIKIIEEDGEN